jgi:mannose/fructose-specific phosphotransferase system component IIA
LAGVNLPMLIRAYNYADDDLDSLCRKAVDGGVRGIHARSREEALQHREQGG